MVGKKRCGKGTACKILQRLIVEKPVFLVSTGDEMRKELAYKLFGLALRRYTVAEMVAELDKLKELLPEMRRMQQEYYQRRKLECGESYWLDKLAAHISKLGAQQPTIVLLDRVSHQYEADWIRKHGGLLYRISRPDVDSKNTDTHVSEIELERISCDLVFCNTGDLRGFTNLLYLTLHHYKQTFGTMKQPVELNYEELTN